MNGCCTMMKPLKKINEKAKRVKMLSLVNMINAKRYMTSNDLLERIVIAAGFGEELIPFANIDSAKDSTNGA
jgi:hypothetical protein